MALCWRCFKPVNSQASILCKNCHLLESAKVHAREGLPVGCTSSSQEYELLPISTRRISYAEEKAFNRTSRNGRVNRKGARES